jgi:Root cap
LVQLFILKFCSVYVDRIPNCNGYGSVCYDPRFVGGDGVMFYFHGANGGDFALVSEERFQINVHFIGTRPEGRKRDFTWVQALSVMFDSHTLVIAARKVAKWDDNIDALAINWDGKDITVPTDGDAEWQNGNNAIAVVERTRQFNSIKVTVLNGLIEMDVKVVPITEEDDKMHGYNIPQGDSFAHLETQFKFGNLTEHVEGILGQTYQSGYVSPVKKGVAMPMMGGEDRYCTSSLLSTKCVSCRFHRPVSFTEDNSAPLKLAQA